MGHLSEVDLIDLAEGTRAESSAPHLAWCERCRRELAALRQTMADAADIEVPEPSPLFWDHFSTRVSEAVAGEVARAQPSFASRLRGAVLDALGRRAVLWPAVAAVAALAIAVGVRSPSRADPDRVGITASDPVASVAPAADDPALVLVSQMAGSLDEESASALAPVDITTHPGVVEESVNGMSA